MYPFKEAPMSTISRVFRRRSDRLVIESYPLHTERPEWAAHAPAQVRAACKRGADVIHFTEVTPDLVHSLAGVAAQHGYGFVHGEGGDVALAFKMTLDAKGSTVHVPGSPRSMAKVEFDFHGSPVTVFGGHLMTPHPRNMAVRNAQIAGVTGLMDAASKGKRLAFFMLDSNPTRPLFSKSGSPRKEFDAAGLVLASNEAHLSRNPGVTTVGRNLRDGRVKAVKAVLGSALGSDHQPLTVTYRVQRP
jgi:hypothetical protein